MRRVLVLTIAMAVMMALAVPASAGGNGATQTSGTGFFDGVPGALGECDGTDAPAAWDLVIRIEGDTADDLNGCLYQTFETGVFRPSGTYFETGVEKFVGTFNGVPGTFTTEYVFTAKYAEIGNFDTEIFGRCQHPIVTGSGMGVFEGATGRIDFKDVLEGEGAPFFPMRGHIRLANGA